MATARHHHGRKEILLPRRRCDHHAGNGSGVFDLVDRPLRYAAGDDAALLRILRGTLIGGLAAAVGTVAFAAIT